LPAQERAPEEPAEHRSDYLYSRKTLFFCTGNTLQGRFFTLGFMASRYSFEMEGAIGLKRIALRQDSIRTNSLPTAGYLTHFQEPDSNVSVSIATVRTYQREKFNFLGALCELHAGLNFKAWIYDNDGGADSVSIDNSEMSDNRNEPKEYLYFYGNRMEFSAGPSVKIRISSGKDNGEAAFSIVGSMDLNYHFSEKRPSVTLSLGIMLAPFSY
jgi:hypothetical protein